MKTLWAKIDTINETTYDTKTLSVILEDLSRLTCRIDETAEVKIGEIYRFEGEDIIFKERPQFLIHQATHLLNAQQTHTEIERLMSIFYSYAPVSIPKVKTSIENTLNSIKNEHIKMITEKIYVKYETDFYRYPAATKFHHAYIGGLSYHTNTMISLAENLLKTYEFLNRDLLIAGIILHDICKTIELSNYKEPEYTTEGRLIGHITMGVKEVTKAAIELDLYDTEERLLLEHMILSHHYYGNFGSPKKPNIPEALALHFIDNIDSKFTVLKEALEVTEAGDFTAPIPVIDREKFYKSKIKK